MYNPNGTLLRKTDAKGQKTEYAYDSLNRLIGISRLPAGSLDPDPCHGVTFYQDGNPFEPDFSVNAWGGWGRSSKVRRPA